MQTRRPPEGRSDLFRIGTARYSGWNARDGQGNLRMEPVIIAPRYNFRPSFSKSAIITLKYGLA